MEIPIDLVELMLKKSTEKGNKSFDRFGLSQLHIPINENLPNQYKPLGKRYIYDTIFLGLEKAKRENQELINLDRSCLDSIVYYLGFKSIDEFRSQEAPLLPNEFFSIEGNWQSIVRCNSGAPDILVSPVKISITDSNKAILELRGPSRTYRGVIRWIGGSISSFIVSEDKVKALHLAFKVGVAKQPEVLLGVFSGVSSSGVPIAGKEILLRSNAVFEEIKNTRIKIASKDLRIPSSVFEYFSDFEKCYFKVTNTSTFNLDDL